MTGTIRNLGLVVLLLVGAVAGGWSVAVAAEDRRAVAAQDEQAVDCTFPRTVEDATGRTVTIEEEPQRVVVLAPSAAQTMWAIGAEEKVVGMPVNEYTAYLNGSQSRENVVVSTGKPKPEVIVGLEPDVVLAPNLVDNETVESLRDKGLTVYRFHPAASFEDVYAKTERTGLLVGEYEQAARVSAHMQGEVEAIERAVADEERPRVYYAMSGGYTAGPGSFIHEILTTAGGHNIAADANISFYEPISNEVIAEQDPQYIVVTDGVPLPDNPAVQNSTAVQKGQVIEVDSNFMSQPGPRNTVPLKTLAAAFHPEASRNVDFESVETPTPATCAVASTTAATPATQASTGEPTATTTTAVDGAGFGVTVALVSLLAVVALSRRR